MDKEEKTSEFLERHTIVNEHGVKQINVVAAINELHARVKSALLAIREINDGLGDFANWGTQIDERVNKLEGKKSIEVVSEHDAKKLLS